MLPLAVLGRNWAQTCTNQKPKGGRVSLRACLMRLKIVIGVTPPVVTLPLQEVREHVILMVDMHVDTTYFVL